MAHMRRNSEESKKKTIIIIHRMTGENNLKYVCNTKKKTGMSSICISDVSVCSIHGACIIDSWLGHRIFSRFFFHTLHSPFLSFFFLNNFGVRRMFFFRLNYVSFYVSMDTNAVKKKKRCTARVRTFFKPIMHWRLHS